jgi:hypothetical protein
MKTSLQERFDAFNQAHPEIYTEFKLLALRLYEQGREHYGAKAIFEYIRLNRALDGRGDGEAYKINNSYVSRYARLLIGEDERLGSFFELRQLKS